MSDAEPSVALAVDHLKVDKVSIWNSSEASVLVKLTPLLSVFITGIALLVSSGIQVWQGTSGNQEKTETAWRGALEKVTLEDKQAIVAALEMQTFFEDKRYGEQARALATVILPKVTDPDAFDTALFAMRGGPRAMNERHYASMARAITNELHNLHASAMQSRGDGSVATDSTFGDFVEHPERFLNDTTQTRELHMAQADTWKLDSISDILHNTWRDARTQQLPRDTDLSGIALMNRDFSGIDFRNAGMDGAMFLGACKVRQEWLPSNVAVHCGKP